jgi:hypothetical protein
VTKAGRAGKTYSRWVPKKKKSCGFTVTNQRCSKLGGLPRRSVRRPRFDPGKPAPQLREGGGFGQRVVLAVDLAVSSQACRSDQTLARVQQQNDGRPARRSRRGALTTSGGSPTSPAQPPFTAIVGTPTQAAAGGGTSSVSGPAGFIVMYCATRGASPMLLAAECGSRVSQMIKLA